MITKLDLPHSFVAEPVEKRIGLVLLATDHMSELDFARAFPLDRVGIYANRVAYENPTTPANLGKMLPRIKEAAELILPEEKLDVLYYSCTSASVVLGDEQVRRLLVEAKPEAKVITPVSALLEALQTLSAKKISLLTPYLPETSAPIEAFLEIEGYKVCKHTCLGIADDRVMARLDRETLLNAAQMAVDPQSDVLFISCTALPVAALIPELEHLTGKRVVTSNHAAIWSAWHGLGLPFDDAVMAQRAVRSASERHLALTA
ncbi:ectoine utilization protein EutA [Rhodobacteraceae bacterium RKSG542]|uniref:aspartate racemase/maleate isomerase family protein n=1 Tax=Pseudovibrio flavus TaxID=2529854 RepID=UPI0012BBD361|nr:aspartate/glutamate racemase family protein [Pseudovibrio flavus]MTI17498.1 ectoine utilization protein EutA [Pseudovibrio flavus]